jgi:hypothetical protein
MHIEFDLARPLARPDIDRDTTTIIGAMLRSISEQFIQN